MHYYDPNPWAILVAAAATFALGSLWYVALFGEAWRHLHGYVDLSPERLDQLQRSARKAHPVAFAGYLATAAGLSLMADYFILQSAAQALKMAALVFVCFLGPVGLAASMYSGKPLAAWLIDAVYQLLYLIIMSLIVTLWV